MYAFKSSALVILLAGLLAVVSGVPTISSSAFPATTGIPFSASASSWFESINGTTANLRITLSSSFNVSSWCLRVTSNSPSSMTFPAQQKVSSYLLGSSSLTSGGVFSQPVGLSSVVSSDRSYVTVCDSTGTGSRSGLMAGTNYTMSIQSVLFVYAGASTTIANPTFAMTLSNSADNPLSAFAVAVTNVGPEQAILAAQGLYLSKTAFFSYLGISSTQVAASSFYPWSIVVPFATSVGAVGTTVYAVFNMTLPWGSCVLNGLLPGSYDWQALGTVSSSGTYSQAVPTGGFGTANPALTVLDPGANGRSMFYCTGNGVIGATPEVPVGLFGVPQTITGYLDFTSNVINSQGVGSLSTITSATSYVIPVPSLYVRTPGTFSYSGQNWLNTSTVSAFCFNATATSVYTGVNLCSVSECSHEGVQLPLVNSSHCNVTSIRYGGSVSMLLSGSSTYLPSNVTIGFSVQNVGSGSISSAFSVIPLVSFPSVVNATAALNVRTGLLYVSRLIYTPNAMRLRQSLVGGRHGVGIGFNSSSAGFSTSYSMLGSDYWTASSTDSVAASLPVSCVNLVNTFVNVTGLDCVQFGSSNPYSMSALFKWTSNSPKPYCSAATIPQGSSGCGVGTFGNDFALRLARNTFLGLGKFAAVEFLADIGTRAGSGASVTDDASRLVFAAAFKYDSAPQTGAFTANATSRYFGSTDSGLSASFSAENRVRSHRAIFYRSPLAAFEYNLTLPATAAVPSSAPSGLTASRAVLWIPGMNISACSAVSTSVSYFSDYSVGGVQTLLVPMFPVNCSVLAIDSVSVFLVPANITTSGFKATRPSISAVSVYLTGEIVSASTGAFGGATWTVYSTAGALGSVGVVAVPAVTGPTEDSVFAPKYASQSAGGDLVLDLSMVDVGSAGSTGLSNIPIYGCSSVSFSTGLPWNKLLATTPAIGDLTSGSFLGLSSGSGCSAASVSVNGYGYSDSSALLGSSQWIAAASMLNFIPLTIVLNCNVSTSPSATLVSIPTIVPISGYLSGSVRLAGENQVNGPVDFANSTVNMSLTASYVPGLTIDRSGLFLNSPSLSTLGWKYTVSVVNPGSNLLIGNAYSGSPATSTPVYIPWNVSAGTNIAKLSVAGSSVANGTLASLVLWDATAAAAAVAVSTTFGPFIQKILPVGQVRAPAISVVSGSQIVAVTCSNATVGAVNRVRVDATFAYPTSVVNISAPIGFSVGASGLSSTVAMLSGGSLSSVRDITGSSGYLNSQPVAPSASLTFASLATTVSFVMSVINPSVYDPSLVNLTWTLNATGPGIPAAVLPASSFHAISYFNSCALQPATTGMSLWSAVPSSVAFSPTSQWQITAQFPYPIDSSKSNFVIADSSGGAGALFSGSTCLSSQETYVSDSLQYISSYNSGQVSCSIINSTAATVSFSEGIDPNKVYHMTGVFSGAARSTTLGIYGTANSSFLLNATTPSVS